MGAGDPVGRAVVIGAGMSGLAAAVDLAKAGADVLILEQSDRAGGAARSHAVDGWIFEDGPTSVLDTNGVFSAFCADLGIVGELVEAKPDVKIRYLHHAGSLQRIPSGPSEILTTPLLTLGERIRFLRETFLAARPDDGEEETIAAFLARRFGSGVAAKYGAALVSGVFAGDPERLSVDAAFPELRAIEREHGSVLRGAAARARSGRRRALLSLRSGLGRVGDAARAFFGPRLRTGVRVEAVHQRDGGIEVVTDSGGTTDHVRADVAIIATPAHAAARLVRPIVPEAASALLGIEHASLAVVQAGFRSEELPGLPPGFGFLVPRGTGLESLGWIFLSQVFEGRAPAGCVALTGFFGGILSPAAFSLGDRELGDLAAAELGRALGIDHSPKPSFLRIVRCKDALPQYHLGHRQRLEKVIGMLDRECPRLRLAGNYSGGISVPSAIESGRAAAAALQTRTAVA